MICASTLRYVLAAHGTTCAAHCNCCLLHNTIVCLQKNHCEAEHTQKPLLRLIKTTTWLTAVFEIKHVQCSYLTP